MPNCLERHSLCTEANWGLPTQHFQKGIVVGINKKYQKQKKKKKKKKHILFHHQNNAVLEKSLCPAKTWNHQQITDNTEIYDTKVNFLLCSCNSMPIDKQNKIKLQQGKK